MPAATSERYTIISADCHAGGSHTMYREYLDPQYRDDFDAWRNRYRNPFRDLQDGNRVRNWDDERRIGEQDADGVVAEVVFPNTVPPFFPAMAVMAPTPRPEEFEHRLAGVRAHNRWLADWCARHPERRAGIGQIFLNDVDEAIKDVRWIKEHGLRGGVLLPNNPPDVDWVPPLYDPVYDRLWAVCQDLEVPVNSHGGQGSPSYGRYPATPFLFLAEATFYSQRPFVHLLLAGVFERFPRLRFVITETGCAWLPPLLDALDAQLGEIRATGRAGELRFDTDGVLPLQPSDYFRRNCWIGVSFPKRSDAAALERIGVERFLWGSDYPHREGTYPYTREHLRQMFSGTDEATLRRILAGNAAEVYGFDLAALDGIAAEVGPTVTEIAQPLLEIPADATSPAFRS